MHIDSPHTCNKAKLFPKAIAQIYEDIHDGEEAGQLTIGGYLHRVVGTILNVVG